jgi:hypothetical protein
VLDVIEHLFMHMFNGLATKYASELEAVQAQYPFEPIAAKPVRLTFAGAAAYVCAAMSNSVKCLRMLLLAVSFTEPVAAQPVRLTS